MTLADGEMNDRILTRLGRAPSRESLAKGAFKQSGLVGIEGDEAGQIREAMLSHWSDRDAFVEAMKGQYDRSAAQYGSLYDNEHAIAEREVDQNKAIQKGAKTKTRIPGDSESGPCPECEAAAFETTDITSEYESGSRLPQLHVGCVCGEEYNDNEGGMI